MVYVSDVSPRTLVRRNTRRSVPNSRLWCIRYSRIAKRPIRVSWLSWASTCSTPSFSSENVDLSTRLRRRYLSTHPHERLSKYIVTSRNTKRIMNRIFTTWLSWSAVLLVILLSVSLCSSSGISVFKRFLTQWDNDEWWWLNPYNIDIVLLRLVWQCNMKWKA